MEEILDSRITSDEEIEPDWWQFLQNLVSGEKPSQWVLSERLKVQFEIMRALNLIDESGQFYLSLEKFDDWINWCEKIVKKIRSEQCSEPSDVLCHIIGPMFNQAVLQELIKAMLETEKYKQYYGWRDLKGDEIAWIRDAALSLSQWEEFLLESWGTDINKKELIKALRVDKADFMKEHFEDRGILKKAKNQVLKNFWVTNTARPSWDDLWAVALSG